MKEKKKRSKSEIMDTITFVISIMAFITIIGLAIAWIVTSIAGHPASFILGILFSAIGIVYLVACFTITSIAITVTVIKEKKNGSTK